MIDHLKLPITHARNAGRIFEKMARNKTYKPYDLQLLITDFMYT
jgi:hypothetical protein